MCGIFGQISGIPPGSECTAVMKHRGPDDFGTGEFPVAGTPFNVVLSHRRLAIIDLSPAGHQPFSNEDGTIWITFNGEVYNFQDLRAELIAHGHQFRSQTDTEVIVHGYEQWGHDVVTRLRGMFAFAIWDAPRRRLFIARDRIGKKPLFYAFNHRRFAFASEIKALLATGSVSRTPDPVGLHHYLTYLYFPAPYTAFKDVRKLGSARCASVEVGADGMLAYREWSYWDPITAAGKAPISSTEAVEQTYALLEESIRLRLIADVPLGIFLSGGMDSSTITALASRQGRDRVKTFTVSFPSHKAYDELPQAMAVSKKFNTEHHILPANSSCVEYMPTVVRHFDEPFGNPTAILEYVITRLMRSHVTVALSGDGGDEIFGGYERYRGVALAAHVRRLPGFITRGLMPRAAGLLRDSAYGSHFLRRLRQFGQNAWRDEADMYLSWVGYFSESDKFQIYTPGFSSQVQGCDAGDFIRNLFQNASCLDPVSRLGYVDLGSFLTCNCLEYSDRMSMANSLEVRCPFTDHKLIELILQLPGNMKLRGAETKHILKQTMRSILPEEVLTQRKQGFSAPISRWMRKDLLPLLDQLPASSVCTEAGMFQPAAVKRLVTEHITGKRDNGLKLWGLLMLDLWFRMYIAGEPEEAVAREFAVLAPA
jgi:asparagine synthase (glutamine-hydrolysing)